MPNIKYQVFVSSTYLDLREERLAISHAILDLGHIPAGMELFPAADVEQLDYIKRVTDECDYYVLVLGARYGSLDDSGVSYTEREYQYAVSSSKPVLAFLHENIDDIPLGKSDKDLTKLLKLNDFRQRVSTGRIVQMWTDISSLTSQAIIALTRAFSSQPQVGWIRANEVPSQAAATDILKLREENDKLTKELRGARATQKPTFPDAAGLNQSITLSYNYVIGAHSSQRSASRDMTIKDAFLLAAPSLHTPSTLHGVMSGLVFAMKDRYKLEGRSYSARQSDVQSLLMHLVATGHVKMWAAQTTDNSRNVTGYQLTPLGVKVWQEESYIRKTDDQKSA